MFKGSMVALVTPFRDGVFDEKRYFTKGNGIKNFDYNGAAFAVSICEDIWTENGPCRAAAKAGAKILLNL